MAYLPVLWSGNTEKANGYKGFKFIGETQLKGLTVALPRNESNLNTIGTVQGFPDTCAGYPTTGKTQPERNSKQNQTEYRIQNPKYKIQNRKYKIQYNN